MGLGGEAGPQRASLVSSGSSHEYEQSLSALRKDAAARLEANGAPGPAQRSPSNGSRNSGTYENAVHPHPGIKRQPTPPSTSSRPHTPKQALMQVCTIPNASSD